VIPVREIFFSLAVCLGAALISRHFEADCLFISVTRILKADNLFIAVESFFAVELPCCFLYYAFGRHEFAPRRRA
jgi:hypothetical protein